MKSTQRPSKSPKQQSKSQEPSLNQNLSSICDESIEQNETKFQLVTAANELPLQQIELPAMFDEKPQSVSALPNEELEQHSKPQSVLKTRTQKPESPERFQHVKFLDCDKPVSRIIFECWHCFQGIICEYTGEPAIGEYKGRPSRIQIPVQCPNCKKTAIRLNTGEVLSTTAIPSPWEQ